MAEKRSVTSEEKELRRHLRDLTGSVTLFSKRMDDLMREPESHERGQKFAKLLNALEVASQTAMHFGLGMTFKAQSELLSFIDTLLAERKEMLATIHDNHSAVESHNAGRAGRTVQPCVCKFCQEYRSTLEGGSNGTAA